MIALSGLRKSAGVMAAVVGSCQWPAFVPPEGAANAAFHRPPGALSGVSTIAFCNYADRGSLFGGGQSGRRATLTTATLRGRVDRADGRRARIPASVADRADGPDRLSGTTVGDAPDAAGYSHHNAQHPSAPSFRRIPCRNLRELPAGELTDERYF